MARIHPRVGRRRPAFSDHTRCACPRRARGVREETGIEPELSTTGGTSDGRFIAQVCPEVLELGPPNASIHKIDEHVAVAELETLKNIYRRLLSQFAE